ncbi:winged helix-turn-helix transcriptional regulator [Clostridium sp. 'deep sea']|uniref:MarR family winged helix-turn-helix transcriptional regulator n=1 Tax=Clostridium sp. 'deep sea' TaxID=2779445 RepID=UPI0018966254|nr:MarR family winged helix-turn-helix transcriptional regulator [Clostridium sp. 'deep sea']QOR35033.1 winged helix-turn-helix transcriptional regulator [Clostridium sp. 'deep sea']
MNKDHVGQLNQLFFEYITLYHHRIGHIFTVDNNDEPLCNKNQKKALFVIKKYRRVIQKDLGKSMDLSKGALTSLLDSLEEVNLIKRISDKDDRRKRWLELTQQGLEYTNAKLTLYENELSKMLKNVEEKEILRAINNLKQLTSFIETI